MFRWQIDTSDYVESNEWKLLEYPAAKNILKYPCCVEPYPDLTYTIRVKRIAVFYSFILVLPCVLLSLLTLVSFWLPPESPAKVLLGRSRLAISLHALYPVHTARCRRDSTVELSRVGGVY